MIQSPRPLTAGTPAGLPPDHLEGFVWRFCGQEGFRLGLPLEAFRVTCPTEDIFAGRRGPDRAVRDHSGVFHLVGVDRSFCLGAFDRSTWCERQIRASAAYTLDVPGVPLELRCDRGQGRWPLPLVGSTPLALIRRRLVETFGPGCAVCADPWAWNVDHDHRTGEVRGYLCGSCNTAVAECRHLTICRFIDYVRNPPARPLGLVYPRHASQAASALQSARQACFDLVMAGGTSSGTGGLLSATRNVSSPRRR